MQRKWIMVNLRWPAALMSLSVLLLVTSFACGEVGGYKEDFDTDAGGWGGNGASHQSTGGNPASGGYHEASRATYNPYHNPETGRAAESLSGNLVERYGQRFRLSMDIKYISGGNLGFIAYIYGKNANGEETFWHRTLVAPGNVPDEWDRISVDVDAFDKAGWTRGSGTMSFYDTLCNVTELSLFGGQGKWNGTTVTGIDNFEVTPAASGTIKAPETFDSWAVDRKYRVLVDVQTPQESFPEHMPFRKRVHFGQLLKKAGVGEAFVPSSVVVTNYDESIGKETVVPHLMSESFQAGVLGDISWDIAKGDQRRDAIYFDTQLREKPKSSYIPLIGHGDNIRYNRKDGLGQMATLGMRPATGDVDGDGLVDVISPSIYASTWGQPEFTFWFWKNVGTNEEPVFADFLRLHDVNGKVIPNNYNNCDLHDWNNDGLLDLVTAKEVYLNTGEVSATGMPGFKKKRDAKIWSSPGHYVFFIGLRDHDADGVKDAFYYEYKVHYDYEGNPSRNFVQTTLLKIKNTARAGQPPRFSSRAKVELDGKTTHENYLVSDFYDFDGDGDLDCIGEMLAYDQVPSTPKLVYWPNTTGPGEAPVYGEAKVAPNYDTFGDSPAIAADNEAFKGLLVLEGQLVRYFERVETSQPGQIPNHQDRGVLQQFNGRCTVGGFNGIDVEDWEGDGDWDLISGDERGRVWLIKNIGDNERPVFEALVQIQSDAKPMRVMRWHYIQDGNPEYYHGQSKPRYVDWDGDRDKDLIVGNNTDRLVLFRNIGTRETPVFDKAEEINTSLNSKKTPFVFRNQPAVVDWNGDGMMDILTRDKGGRLCLFFGTGEGESLIVKKGKPLIYADGGAIWNHRKKHAVGQWEVCDWDGDGDYDIISQEGKWGKAGPGLLENVGSNEKPKFNRPKQLSCFGTGISLSNHEHSFAVVDWYNQGKHDLVCGSESGMFFFFRRPTLDAKTLPAASMSPQLEIKDGE